MRSVSYIVGISIYIAALFGGTLIVQSSWDGQSYALYSGEERTPAAYYKSFDFSPFDGHHLQIRGQERILEEAHVRVVEDFFEIKLGMFTVRDPSSIVIRPTLACNVYETIEVTFIAEGMAVNDSSPTLNVSAPCAVDINQKGMVSIIRVPLTIFGNRRLASDFSESIPETDTTVSVNNLSDSWPDQWSIYSIRLDDKDAYLRPIEVTHENILKSDAKVRERLILSNYKP